LPFPAALLDHNGAIVQANREWDTPRENTWRWAGSLPYFSPERRAELTTGIERVLDHLQDRYVQDYGGPEHPRRVIVSACAGGALILHHALAPSTPAGPDKQAQKSGDAGLLVAGVAHDFANLLTLITGHCALLLNRVGAKDPLRPGLEEIRSAVQHASQLTAQLLGFLRGQTEQPKELDLNALVVNLQGMLGPILGESVQFQTTLAANLAKVVVDPSQMEQVVMNLILNARDAMPTGGCIRIETSSLHLDEATARTLGVPPGPCVTLSISDTGHGIDARAMEHLFEPFFTTKDKGKGTGLGLSTVQAILKRYGGDIRVSSAPGEGATFTVCLPCVRRTAGAEFPNSTV
jgi:signal transduction histidine kinase